MAANPWPPIRLQDFVVSEMESLFCFTSNTKILNIYLCLYPTSQNIQAMLLRKITGPALATKFLSVPPKENLMDHQCVCVSECVCVCVCVRTCAHVSHSSVSDSLWSHDCSPPGSSIQGILPARTLERVAISFSRESSWPRDQTQISCIACRLFIIWATRELHKRLRIWAQRNLPDSVS